MAQLSALADPAASLAPADRDWLQDRTSAIRELFRRSAVATIATGRIIQEVKARIGHGAYLKWVAAALPFTERTAQRLLAVAEAFASLQDDIVSCFEPTALYVLVQQDTPDAAREKAVELAEQGVRIDASQARKLVSGYKALAAPPPPVVEVADADDDTPPPIAAPLPVERPAMSEVIPLGTAAARWYTFVGWLASAKDRIEWAERIGTQVANHYQLHGSRADDVRAIAVATMTAKANAFEPAEVPTSGDMVDAFKGWAHPSVECECKRECQRLINGGIYNTTRTPELAPAVVGLPEGT